MALPACGIMFGPRFQAEVSTDQMVGTASSSYFETASSTATLKSEMAQVLGLAESAPTGVVIVETPPSVAKVVVQFTGGPSDQMTPVQGWSVLAGSVPAANGSTKFAQTTGPKIGTLKAIGASGQVLATSAVSEGLYGGLPTPQPAYACAPMCPLVANGAGAAPSGAVSACAQCGVASSGGGAVYGSSVSGGAQPASTQPATAPLRTSICVAPPAVGVSPPTTGSSTGGASGGSGGSGGSGASGSSSGASSSGASISGASSGSAQTGSATTP